MNAILENMKTRRSVRAFTDRQVEQELLEQVIEAGMWAPTGRNLQTPVIIAVQNGEDRDAVSMLNRKLRGGDRDPYYGAPTIVLVLVEESSTNVEDGALCLGNMLNAAHAVGLAGCWIHGEHLMFEDEEGKSLLQKWGIPGKLRGVGSIALGYAAGPLPEARPRKEGYAYII